MSTEKSRQETQARVSAQAIQTIKSVKAKEALAAEYINMDHPEYRAAGYRILYDMQRLNSKNRRVRGILKEKGFTFFPGFPKEYFKRPNCGALSPGGKLFATGYGSIIQIINLAADQKNILHSFSIKDDIREIRWVGDILLVLTINGLFKVILTSLQVKKIQTSKKVESISPYGGKALVRFNSKKEEAHLQICHIDSFNGLEIKPDFEFPFVTVLKSTRIMASWSDCESRLGVQLSDWFSKKRDYWLFDLKDGHSLVHISDVPSTSNFLLGTDAYLIYDIKSLELSVYSFDGELIKSFDFSNNRLNKLLKINDNHDDTSSLITDEQEPVLPIYMKQDHVFLMGGRSMLIYQLDLQQETISSIKPKDHEINVAYPIDLPFFTKVSPEKWVVRRPLITKKKREPEWFEYGKYGFEDDEYFSAQREYWNDLIHPPNEKTSILSVDEEWQHQYLQTQAMVTEHEPELICSCFTNGGNGIASIMKKTTRYSDYPDWKTSYEVVFFDIETGIIKGKPWELTHDLNEGIPITYDGWYIDSIVDVHYNWNNQYLAIACNFTMNLDYDCKIAGGIIILDLKNRNRCHKIIEQFNSDYKHLDEKNPLYFGGTGLYPLLGIKWNRNDIHVILPENSFVFQTPTFDFIGTIPNTIKKNYSNSIVVGYERYWRTHNKYYCNNSDYIIDSDFRNERNELQVTIDKPGSLKPIHKQLIDTHRNLHDCLNDFYDKFRIGIKTHRKNKYIVSYCRNRIDTYSIKTGKRIIRKQWNEDIIDILIHPVDDYCVILTASSLKYTTIPHIKTLKSILVPPFLTSSSNNEFLRWGARGKRLVVFGKGLWAIDNDAVMENLNLNPKFDRS